MNPAQLLSHFDRISEASNAVPRLRRFILDLAVRGKLVEQNPMDEPAAQLMAHIRSEVNPSLNSRKQLLGQSAANRSIELPYEIPIQWSWIRLGDLLPEFQNGVSSRGEAQGKPTIVLRLADIKNGEISLADTREMLLPDNAGSKYKLENGDTLIVRVNGSADIVGRLVVCRENLSAIYCDHFIRMRVRSSWVTPKFLGILGDSPLIRDQIGSLFITTAGQKTVNQGHISALQIPLPPLAEQQRIVAKVDELMALCDRLGSSQAKRESNRDRLAASSLSRLNNGADPDAFREHARFTLDNLPRLTTRLEYIQQLRQTILNLAVRGQLVSQDPNDEPASELLRRIEAWRSAAIDEKKIRTPRKPLLGIEDSDAAFPYQLPQAWSWARLGELIYIHSGDGLTSESMENGSIPVFGGNGVTGSHNKPNVHRPTVVIGRVGYYCGSVHLTPPQAWVTDNAFITEFCSDAISQSFLVLLLRSTNLKENESATAQPVISGAKIYPIIVGLPPLTEQHRIVAKVDELMALCDRLEAQLTTTQTESRRLLEAVLNEALTS